MKISLRIGPQLLRDLDAARARYDRPVTEIIRKAFAAAQRDPARVVFSPTRDTTTRGSVISIDVEQDIADTPAPRLRAIIRWYLDDQTARAASRPPLKLTDADLGVPAGAYLQEPTDA